MSELPACTRRNDVRSLLTRCTALLILLVLLVPATLHAEQRKTLVFTHSKSMAPLSFLDENGEPEGILIDFWKEWGEQNDVDVQFKLVDWVKTFELVRNGEADVHAGTFFARDGRFELDYSDSFMGLKSYLFVADELGVQRIEDLRNVSVGVLENEYAVGFLQRNYPALRLRFFSNNMSLFEAVKSGEVRAFVRDYHTASFQLTSMGRFSDFRVLEPLFERRLRAAVREGDSRTLALINRGLAEMPPQEAKKILSQWVDRRFRWPSWLIPVLVVLAGLVISGAVVAHLIALRIRVKRKTRELREVYEKISAQHDSLRLEMIERQRIERELHESRERYRILADTAQDVILTCDLDGRLTYINPSGRKLAGVKDSEIGKKKLADIIPEKQCRMIIERCIDAGNEATDDSSFIEATIAKDDSFIPVEFRVSPIHEADKVVGALLIARDIRQRRKDERARITVENQRVVQNLARAVAHEFRQPMTSLHLIAQMVEQGIIDPDQTRRIPELVDRMDNLVERLLRISDVITKPYLNGVEILDIEASSSQNGGTGNGKSTSNGSGSHREAV